MSLKTGENINYQELVKDFTKKDLEGLKELLKFFEGLKDKKDAKLTDFIKGIDENSDELSELEKVLQKAIEKKGSLEEQLNFLRLLILAIEKNIEFVESTKVMVKSMKELVDSIKKTNKNIDTSEFDKTFLSINDKNVLERSKLLYLDFEDIVSDNSLLALSSQERLQNIKTFFSGKDTTKDSKDNKLEKVLKNSGNQEVKNTNFSPVSSKKDDSIKFGKSNSEKSSEVLENVSTVKEAEKNDVASEEKESSIIDKKIEEMGLEELVEAFKYTRDNYDDIDKKIGLYWEDTISELDSAIEIESFQERLIKKIKENEDGKGKYIFFRNSSGRNDIYELSDSNEDNEKKRKEFSEMFQKYEDSGSRLDITNDRNQIIKMGKETYSNLMGKDNYFFLKNPEMITFLINSEKPEDEKNFEKIDNIINYFNEKGKKIDIDKININFHGKYMSNEKVSFQPYKLLVLDQTDFINNYKSIFNRIISKDKEGLLPTFIQKFMSIEDLSIDDFLRLLKEKYKTPLSIPKQIIDTISNSNFRDLYFIKDLKSFSTKEVENKKELYKKGFEKTDKDIGTLLEGKSIEDIINYYENLEEDKKINICLYILENGKTELYKGFIEKGIIGPDSILYNSVKKNREMSEIAVRNDILNLDYIKPKYRDLAMFKIVMSKYGGKEYIDIVTSFLDSFNFKDINEFLECVAILLSNGILLSEISNHNFFMKGAKLFFSKENVYLDKKYKELYQKLREDLVNNFETVSKLTELMNEGHKKIKEEREKSETDNFDENKKTFLSEKLKDIKNGKSEKIKIKMDKEVFESIKEPIIDGLISGKIHLSISKISSILEGEEFPPKKKNQILEESLKIIKYLNKETKGFIKKGVDNGSIKLSDKAQKLQEKLSKEEGKNNIFTKFLDEIKEKAERNKNFRKQVVNEKGKLDIKKVRELFFKERGIELDTDKKVLNSLLIAGDIDLTLKVFKANPDKDVSEVAEKFIEGGYTSSYDFVSDIESGKVEGFNVPESFKSKGFNNLESVENSSQTQTYIFDKVIYNYNPETGVLKSNGESLELSDQDKQVVGKNPEAMKNLFNFSFVLQKVGLTKLWGIKEKIFTAISNVKGQAFKLDGDYLNENEIMNFLNAILVSVGEKQQDMTTGLDDMVAKVQVLNKIQVFGGMKTENNLYGTTSIEEKFIKKFIPRGNIMGFLTGNFTNAISGRSVYGNK